MSTIEFTLTYEGDLLIKKGDTVSFQTPLYNTQSTETVSVPLAKLLNTDPTKIFNSLKKFVGERVAKGDVIAESASFMSKKTYTSEYDGVLKEINHQEGILIIEAGTEKSNTVNCFFIGEVTDIDEQDSSAAPQNDNQGNKKAIVKLKTKSAKEYALKEVSGDFGGETVFCDDPVKAKLTADEINHKVVVDNKVPSYEQVKYEALGAKGFISLDALSEVSSSHHAQLTDKSEFEKISEHKLPYCLISKTEKKVTFYE